jgi:hypothetical protein
VNGGHIDGGHHTGSLLVQKKSKQLNLKNQSKFMLQDLKKRNCISLMFNVTDATQTKHICCTQSQAGECLTGKKGVEDSKKGAPVGQQDLFLRGCHFDRASTTCPGGDLNASANRCVIKINT